MFHHTNRSQTHQLAQQFCSQWHVAFSVVPSSSVPGVVRTGQLLPSPSLDGLVALTPQLPIACQLTQTAPSRYTMYAIRIQMMHIKILTAEFEAFTVMTSVQ